LHKDAQKIRKKRVFAKAACVAPSSSARGKASAVSKAIQKAACVAPSSSARGKASAVSKAIQKAAGTIARSAAAAIRKATRTISKKPVPRTAKKSAPSKQGIRGSKTDAKGGRKPAPMKARKKQACSVYVLELEGGYVYVGKTSRGVARRLAEHMGKNGAGRGAAFTKLHRPTGRLLPRLGNLEGDGDGPERDETLRQMYRLGVQRVRGWKYVRAGMLRREEIEDIESNIRELFDLCRKCGRSGHFAAGCREAKDRSGGALRAAVVARIV
jgi:hypothetical protein